MRQSRIAAFLLLLLCYSAFSGVGNNGFINFDDRTYLTQNRMVDRGLTAQGLAWAFTSTRGGNWHPATWLSHMLDVQLFGMDPGRHHLASLAIHSCSALLLLASLSAMTGSVWRSFFAAALFAVHPLRVESVAWASERKDVLAMLFTLLALASYLRGLRRVGSGNRLATAVLFTLALLAKPMPVTFPFLLLLLDWWPLGRWRPRRGTSAGFGSACRHTLPPPALVREKAPLFLLAAASSAVALLAQSGVGAVVPGGAIPLAVRTGNALVSWGAYLADTLWPHDLSIFYPHPSTIPHWTAWTASLLLLAGVSVLAWRLRDRSPWLTVGWFWYLGALVPMIGLVQVGGQARADRYTYLPHIGIALLAVWGTAGVVRKPRVLRAMAVAGVAVTLASAAATAAQTSYWRGSVALFTRALALADRLPRAGEPRQRPALSFILNSLGLAYFEEGRAAEAIAQYRRALTLNPFSFTSMNYLANVLEATGQQTEANALYIQALRDRHYAEPRLSLGMMLMSRGNSGDAIRLFREAVAIDPINAMGHALLGAALAMTGNQGEAEPALRTAVALAPEFEPARFNLGKLLLGQRRYEEAIVHLRESIRLEPGQVAAPMLLREAIEAAGGGAPPPP